MGTDRRFTRRELIEKTVAGATAASTVAAAVTESAAGASPPSKSATANPPLPMGKIGNVQIGRMLLGGNLIGGWMHCRDLQYVGDLFRHYATPAKIVETLGVAERYGINTVFETGGDFVQKYNREHGGKMQFIPHIEVRGEQPEAALKDHIKQQVDTGAVALYVWGVSSDSLAYSGQFGKIARAVELAKVHGLPVGVGSHSITVPREMERLKAPVDFYVKTLHRDNYPSATPKERRTDFMWLTGKGGYYDNMWCIDADEVVAFMKSVTNPWIAFKVLAAGAIQPAEGFSYAFRSGADFIAVGMFDFQVAQNSETAARAIADAAHRDRPWRA